MMHGVVSATPKSLDSSNQQVVPEARESVTPRDGRVFPVFLANDALGRRP